jgi:hypothetical protein
MVARMATPQIVALIDNLLATPKTVAGTPTWRDMGHHGQFRLTFPLLIGGESTECALEICAYPNREPLRFNIAIHQPKAIWRLEYCPTASHTNSMNAPKDISGLIIVGPHYHNWADNRRFVTSNSLPKTMKNARLLPEGINDFAAAFEWFCQQTNIETPPANAVVLPVRTELF